MAMENEALDYTESPCCEGEIEIPEPHSGLMLGVAAVLGVMGDALLRAWPWGINLSVWLVACFGALFLLDRARATWTAPLQRLLFGTAAIFCLTFAWRDAPLLNVLSAVVIFTCIALAASPAPLFQWWRVGMFRYATLGVDTAFTFVAMPFRLIERNLSLFQRTGRERFQVLVALLRGLLIALPFLVIFGVLLTSADVLFKEFIKDLFDFDLKTIVSHAAIFTTCTFVAAGMLLLIFEGPLDFVQVPQEHHQFRLGGIEANTAMALLDLLFASFVALQFAHFFGGDARVQAVPGLTYAAYARHGFFELCAVAALALPTLLFFDWLLRSGAPSARAWFRALALVQVLLLAVILVSAMDRMALYREAYGMTLLRFFVVAFLYWLAVLFVWFAATVLSGRRHLFMGGVVVTGALAVLVLHAVNPGACVMRANIERYESMGDFDLGYAKTLSADALIGIADMNESLPPGLREHLVRRWGGEQSDSWRSWNLGRHRARALAKSWAQAAHARHQ